MKTKLTMFLSLIFACLLSCERKPKSVPKSIEKWDVAENDSFISKNPIYKKLNRENEIYSIFDRKDSVLKKSSNVAYYQKNEDTLKNKYLRFNKCKAHMTTDTLFINIGSSSGFSSKGFQIKYYEQKFYTEPYSWSDAEIEELKSTYKLNFQNLILDKAEYKVGDSIFGKIQFESIENNFENKITTKVADGFFRAEIKIK